VSLLSIGGTKKRLPGGDDPEATVNNDYDRIRDLETIKDDGDVRVGVMPNGDKVIVRPSTHDGRPTIEVQHADKSNTRLRYDGGSLVTGYYKKWLQHAAFAVRLEFQGLHHDYEGFRILLAESEGRKRFFSLRFPYPLKYQFSLERNSLSLLDDADLQGWSLFTVDNSDFLRCFHEESKGIHRDEKIEHYLVCTDDVFVDVLCARNVEVRILPDG